MKNRKREICTSGSVRDEDGQPPHLLGRRAFLHLAAGAAARPAICRIAQAQAYPTRPVRIIVTTAAGSAMDVHGRLHGQWLSECGHRPQALSLHGSIIISFPLGSGRNEFGPAVVRVRTTKSAVAGDHLLHAHFVAWQSAIVRKVIALISARAPRHLSGLADAKVEQHCHRCGHYDEH
jgi:hypothetical protein